MKYIPAHVTNFSVGRKQTIDHIVIHYTGNDGDTAEGNGKYFSGAGRAASAHYFVDENEVVQSVREGDVAWHAGNWQMNARSIGVEMCSRKDAGGLYFIPEATVRNAQALVRELMAKYGIGVDAVIRHYDVTGKKCPEPYVRQPALWEKFKEGLRVSTGSKPSAWAKSACDKAVKKGIIQGDDKGDCKWQEPVSTERLMVILDRLGLL